MAKNVSSLKERNSLSCAMWENNLYNQKLHYYFFKETCVINNRALPNKPKKPYKEVLNRIFY